ncbi:MAG: hypothetical protein SO112_03490 [Treponema sp.]|nr:hypothetical protein [Treponema sp.]MDY4985067.1 hypothetical protein [Treponema sp.]
MNHIVSFENEMVITLKAKPWIATTCGLTMTILFPLKKALPF